MSGLQIHACRFFTRTEIVTDLKLLPVVVVGGEQGLSYHTEKWRHWWDDTWPHARLTRSFLRLLTHLRWHTFSYLWALSFAAVVIRWHLAKKKRQNPKLLYVFLSSVILSAVVRCTFYAICISSLLGVGGLGSCPWAHHDCSAFTIPPAGVPQNKAKLSLHFICTHHLFF